MKNVRFRYFDEFLAKSLSDPREAKEYLDVAFEEYQKDYNNAAFVLAVKAVCNVTAV